MTRLALAAIILPLLTASAPADPSAWVPAAPSGDIIELRGKVPSGRIGFCNDYPDLCFWVPSAAPLSSGVLPLLNRINVEVNAAIIERMEPAGEDVWRVAPTHGDCEDYAITKLVLLTSAGVPRDALQLATVITPRGTPHLVLVADTLIGSLVLDNRGDDLKRWDRTGYRWLAIEQNIREIAILWHAVKETKQ